MLYCKYVYLTHVKGVTCLRTCLRLFLQMSIYLSISNLTMYIRVGVSCHTPRRPLSGLPPRARQVTTWPERVRMAGGRRNAVVELVYTWDHPGLLCWINIGHTLFTVAYRIMHTLGTPTRSTLLTPHGRTNFSNSSMNYCKKT
jgi:hypothetical protein